MFKCDLKVERYADGLHVYINGQHTGYIRTFVDAHKDGMGYVCLDQDANEFAEAAELREAIGHFVDREWDTFAGSEPDDSVVCYY